MKFSSFLQLNSKITQFSDLIRLEEEQDDTSSFGVKKICDPFSGAPNFSYAPANCSKDSIPIGALPGVSDYTQGKNIKTINFSKNNKRMLQTE